MRSLRLKSLLCLALLLCFRPDSCPAQQPSEFSPLVFRMIGGSASVENGTVRYENGTGYGLAFGQRVEDNVTIELSYVLFPTRGHFDPASGSTASPVTLDFSVHYVQFGAAYHALKDRVQPFLSTTCGVVWFRPGESKYSGDWRFAFSTVLGLKLFVTENVGFRVQARAIFPVYFSQGGLWAGVEGTGSGFKAGIRVVQADLGAGMVVSF